jgi:uncharacterized protein (TIGR01777 family)
VLSRGSGGDVKGEVEASGPWQDAIDGCDAVVNLAGEPLVGRRWNAHQKQKIHDSRVEGTARVVEAIERAKAKPKVLINASGVDIYPFAAGPGDFDDDDITEADPPADDSYLARVCKNWEAEAARAPVRVVMMRMGVVLGGRKMPPIRIGNGRQWFSWVHLDDVVRAYLAAIDDDRYVGPINLVAGSIRARELGWLPVPGFALRAMLGGLADYLLNGRKVVPAKLEKLGFRFEVSSPARGRTSAPAGSSSDARP